MRILGILLTQPGQFSGLGGGIRNCILFSAMAWKLFFSLSLFEVYCIRSLSCSCYCRFLLLFFFILTGIGETNL